MAKTGFVLCMWRKHISAKIVYTKKCIYGLTDAFLCASHSHALTRVKHNQSMLQVFMHVSSMQTSMHVL